VQVVIEVPKKLSKEEQTLLRELAELEHKHVAPERKSFFERLKDYFTADEEVSESNNG
jgi:molecular chaperone DnaJ